ncbi:hypothetical protein [Rhodopirellula sp. MGV]|uniref:hypothetical protein n=1 Tax=Rhodopirellula sp. MGV TaxID=2023130 RepID=UPI000B962F3E|nr:hypothetical protein [Rhodopirellula sp. MGV]OYP32202.1 hypothetical protein CGZ80_20330 [Rhodopirellula sp. MGV]PNY35559.1 hypothetical protein C2E31_18900 [Rhodopirellula baltica]
MADSSPENKNPTLGYLTVVNDEFTGWTGGMLVLDRGGRPIEFQCTLPVRPTKAHEILFGPTLRSHLISEVIGKLLIQKCRTPLSIVCTDLADAMEIEAFTQAPVILVREAIENEDGSIDVKGADELEAVPFAGATFLAPIDVASKVESFAGRFGDLPDAVEPFERIREAIKEAHSQLARQQSGAA